MSILAQFYAQQMMTPDLKSSEKAIKPAYIDAMAGLQGSTPQVEEAAAMNGSGPEAAAKSNAEVFGDLTARLYERQQAKREGMRAAREAERERAAREGDEFERISKETKKLIRKGATQAAFGSTEEEEGDSE